MSYIGRKLTTSSIIGMMLVELTSGQFFVPTIMGGGCESYYPLRSSGEPGKFPSWRLFSWFGLYNFLGIIDTFV